MITLKSLFHFVNIFSRKNIKQNEDFQNVSIYKTYLKYIA